MADPTLYNTEEIIRLLQLEPTGPDTYRGQSHFMGSPNVFGGQVLGQSLYAAVSTVDGRRPSTVLTAAYSDCPSTCPPNTLGLPMK